MTVVAGSYLEQQLYRSLPAGPYAGDLFRKHHRLRGAAPPPCQTRFCGCVLPTDVNSKPSRRTRNASVSPPPTILRGGCFGTGGESSSGDKLERVDIFGVLNGKRQRGKGYVSSPTISSRVDLEVLSDRRLCGLNIVSPRAPAAQLRGGRLLENTQLDLSPPRRKRGTSEPPPALHGAVHLSDIHATERPSGRGERLPSWWRAAPPPPIYISTTRTPNSRKESNSSSRRSTLSPSRRTSPTSALAGEMSPPSPRGQVSLGSPMSVQSVSNYSLTSPARVGKDDSSIGSTVIEPGFVSPPLSPSFAWLQLKEKKCDWRLVVAGLKTQGKLSSAAQATLEEFVKKADEEEVQLRARLLEERAKLSVTSSKGNVCKFSQRVLDLRKKETLAAKQKQYAEASALRDEAIRVEKHERFLHESLREKWMNRQEAARRQAEAAEAGKLQHKLYEELFALAYYGALSTVP